MTNNTSSHTSFGKDQKFVLIVADLSKVSPKDRMFIWRHVKEYGVVPIIRSVFGLMDTKEGRLRAKKLSDIIEERNGKVWIFSVLAESSMKNIDALIKEKMNAESKEFLEECNEFIADISNEIKEKEFQFYEMEELNDDLRKLEKWKIKIIERYSHSDELYKRIEIKLDKCRKLMKTFEKKCLENM